MKVRILVLLALSIFGQTVYADMCDLLMRRFDIPIAHGIEFKFSQEGQIARFLELKKVPDTYLIQIGSKFFQIGDRIERPGKINDDDWIRHVDFEITSQGRRYNPSEFFDVFAFAQEWSITILRRGAPLWTLTRTTRKGIGLIRINPNFDTGHSVLKVWSSNQDGTFYPPIQTSLSFAQ